MNYSGSMVPDNGLLDAAIQVPFAIAVKVHHLQTVCGFHRLGRLGMNEPVG